METEPNAANYLLQIVLASGLLILYTWARYETPHGIRLSTTWGKFFLGRLLYVLILLGIFLALVATPSVVATIPGVEDVLPNGNGLSGPLLVALILTVFLSEIPLLSKVDQVLRRYFHRLAAIPRERRHWLALLKSAELDLTDDQKRRLKDRLKGQELDANSLLRQAAATPGGLWVRATVLVDSLERIEHHRRYSDLLHELAPEYQALKREYERLTPKAQSCFKLLANHPEDQAIVALLATELGEQIENLLLAFYGVVSSLILSCEKTGSRRHDCVKRLGLRLPEKSARGLSVDEVIWIAMLVVIALVVTATRLGPPLIALIAINYVAATLVALAIVDIRQAFFPRKPARVPPLGLYLLAGIAGASVSSLFSIVFLTFRDQEFLHVLLNLPAERTEAIQAFIKYHWPWQLMYLATAVLIAMLTDPWLTDTKLGALRRRLNLRHWLNPFDALVVGGSVALVAYFWAYPWLVNLGTLEIIPKPPESAWGLARVALIVGLILGAVVPLWHRRKIRTEKTSTEATAAPQRAMILRLDEP